jgi:hypothetical protein
VTRLIGDFDAARRWHEETSRSAIGLVFPTGALLSLWERNEAAARDELATWIRDIGPLVPEVMRYSAVSYISQLVFELGPFDGLDDWIAYAERFPGEFLGADGGLIGAADAARGRFAAVVGDLDRAVDLLEAGHAMHELLGLHQLSVESGVDLGAVLLRRERAADRDRGADLLRSTAELADAIGMAPAVARARALLA